MFAVTPEMYRERVQELCRKTVPYPRPERPNFETLFSYLTCKSSVDNSQQTKVNYTSSILPKHSSHVHDLTKLEPILLRQMEVNKIHYGKYLECILVEDPFIVVAKEFLITDTEQQELEFLNIYNFDIDLNESDLESFQNFLSKGSKIIIKEPYLSIYGYKSCMEFCIRVDSPTDVIIVQHGHHDALINLNFESIIQKGNSYYSNGMYLAALSHYLSALKKNENCSRVYLNLSAVYLKLKNYNQAYNFASKVDELGDFHSQKAYFRKGIAAYNMAQFEKSAINFKKCLEINPLNKEAEIELKRSKERINESQTGVYDFEKLVENIRNGIKEMDVSEFKSNDIEVASLKDGYKGVIAKRPLKKGTLLVVSKAIGASHSDNSEFYFNVEINNQKYRQGNGPQHSIKIIKTIQGNPELAKEVYKLYAGPGYDRNEPIDENIIDIARIDQIVCYNSFGCQDIIKPDMEIGAGLWNFPSYFNHSCIPNATYIFLGDVIFLYAYENIKKDEEIFVQYYPDDLKRTETVEIKKREEWYGFKCRCELCDPKKKDIYEQSKENLLANHKKNVLLYTRSASQLSGPSYSEDIFKEIEKDLEKMRKYSHSKYDTDGIVTLLESSIILKLCSGNFLESAMVMEECSRTTNDMRMALVYLVNAFKIYKHLSMKQQADQCYINGFKHFFSKSQPYYKYVFFELLKHSSLQL